MLRGSVTDKTCRVYSTIVRNCLGYAERIVNDIGAMGPMMSRPPLARATVVLNAKSTSLRNWFRVVYEFQWMPLEMLYDLVSEY